jgi:hypothetical protein
MVKILATIERSDQIRIGQNMSENQGHNTIILNATNQAIEAQTSNSLYIAPIREDDEGEVSKILSYNTTTKEVLVSDFNVADTNPPLQTVTASGNTTTHTIEFRNQNSSLITYGNVAINKTGNEPDHLLCVGDNIHFTQDGKALVEEIRIGSSILINDEGTNQIQVSGNIESGNFLKTHKIAIDNVNPFYEFSFGNSIFMEDGNVHATRFIGDGGLLSNLNEIQNFQNVTSKGNTTDNQVEFNNPLTSFTTAGNVVISGNVTSSYFIGDGTFIEGVALNSDLQDNVLRIIDLETNLVANSQRITNLMFYGLI